MFKRYWPLLLLVAAVVALAAQQPAVTQTVTNALTRFQIGGIPDCKNSRVFCVGKQTGAEYSTICGMTAGTGGANSCGDATDVCTSSSAMRAAINAAGDGSGLPVTVYVGNGRWDECVHIDPSGSSVTAIRNLHLQLAPGAIIRPTVAGATSVNNGVIRVCATSTARDSCKGIEISGGTCQNDASSSPEACVQGGKDGGPGTGKAAPYQDLYVHDMTIIGLHDGLQWFGSLIATDDDPPRVKILRVETISGADVFVMKGISIPVIQDLHVIGWSNYCEDTSSRYLAAQTGTLQGGTAYATTNTSTFTLAAGQLPATDNYFRGRNLILTDADGGGGGTCGANNRSVGTFPISAYDSTTKVVTSTIDTVRANLVATGGTSTTLVQDAASNAFEVGDHYPVDFWMQVTAGTCNGQIRQVTQYNYLTQTFTVTPAWSACTPDGTTVFTVKQHFENPTTGCAYQITPVTHNDGTAYTYPAGTCSASICTVGRVGASCSVNSDCDGEIVDSPCTDVDWSTMREYWKNYLVHFSTSSATGSPDMAKTYIKNLTGEMYINDYGPVETATSCTAQGSVGGIGMMASRWEKIVIDGVDFNFHINTNMRWSTCPYPVMGIGVLGGTSEGGGMFVRNPTLNFDNRGARDIRTAALVSNSTTASSLTYDGAFVDFTTTVAGFTGTNAHLVTNNQNILTTPAIGTMAMGSMRSPDTIVTDLRSGSVSLIPGASSSGSATFDFGSITSTCIETVNGGGAATITVPGAAAGDSCQVGVPTASVLTKSSFACRVSAADTVTVQHCCNNGTCDPASGTFTATVTRK